MSLSSYVFTNLMFQYIYAMLCKLVSSYAFIILNIVIQFKISIYFLFFFLLEKLQQLWQPFFNIIEHFNANLTLVRPALGIVVN